MSINNFVMLDGNVGTDPEVRYNDGGSVVANFTFATNESYKDKAGNWQKETTWHNVTAWNNYAKAVEQKVKKGMSLTIHGELVNECWTDNDGKKHYRSVVMVHAFKIHNSDRQS